MHMKTKTIKAILNDLLSLFEIQNTLIFCCFTWHEIEKGLRAVYIESNCKELLCVWMFNIICNKIFILGGFPISKKKFTMREIGTFFIRIFWTHFLTKFAFGDFIWRLQNLPNVNVKYVVVVFEASSLKIVNVNLKESWKLILSVKSVYSIRCDICLRRY